MACPYRRDESDRMNETSPNRLLNKVAYCLDPEPTPEFFGSTHCETGKSCSFIVIGENKAEEVEGMAFNVTAIDDPLPVEPRLLRNLDVEGFFNGQESTDAMNGGAKGADATDYLWQLVIALADEKGLEKAGQVVEGKCDVLDPATFQFDSDTPVPFDAAQRGYFNGFFHS